MSPEPHGVARDQLRAFIERVERVEEEIASLNTDKSDIYKEAAAVGFDKKTLKKVVARRKVDDSQRQEEDALFEIYWDAVHGANLVHARVRENIEEFDAETGEILDGAANAKLIATVATGMQTEIGRKALVTALDIMIEREEQEERRSDNGLNILTKHEDIRTSVGSQAVLSSLTTREAEESVVTHSPETAAVPSSEQSEGNGSRDHQHAHSRQADDAKHGGQDGEPAGADHATHLPEAANETMGGTGDDCSFGNRGVWPPQGGASSSRGNDSLSVVTAGETATNSQSDDGAFVEVKGRARLANADGVEPSSSGHPAKPKVSFRPNCLQPEMCRSGTRDHCYSCRKAMAQHEDAA